MCRRCRRTDSAAAAFVRTYCSPALLGGRLGGREKLRGILGGRVKMLPDESGGFL